MGIKELCECGGTLGSNYCQRHKEWRYCTTCYYCPGCYVDEDYAKHAKEAAGYHQKAKIAIKPKSSYYFTSLMTSLTSKDNSTVMARIRTLIEVGKVLIEQGEQGVPDDSVLRAFDASLKNLREDG